MSDTTWDMFNPWRYLADHHPDVEVVWTKLPRKMRGCTDGETIWMDRRLTQVQRREVVCHETIHVERGTFPACEAEERTVNRISARRLIEIDDLIEALRENPQQTVSELAAKLWVEPGTMRLRIDTLRPSELELIEATFDPDWDVA
jgi:hypothetical protein